MSLEEGLLRFRGRRVQQRVEWVQLSRSAEEAIIATGRSMVKIIKGLMNS